MKITLETRNQNAWNVLPTELQHSAVLHLIISSFAEDLAPNIDWKNQAGDITRGDVTSLATIAADPILRGKITAKDFGVVAGLPVAAAVFRWADPSISIELLMSDGGAAQPGQVIAQVSGTGRAVLVAERPALNFLGRLSGIATLTRHYVEAIAGTNATILDTRKTMPGFRLLDKYAVRQGGGRNHRMGLYDMALIKDNHIDGAGGVSEAIKKVRKTHGDRLPIEIEVKDLEELETALTLPIDRIMLDNMSLEMMREAVKITAGRVPLEASGNVNLETVRSIAETGVDFISVGALTHSVPNFDVSMRLLSH